MTRVESILLHSYPVGLVDIAFTDPFFVSGKLEIDKNRVSMVTALKFRTPFSFCSQINCWPSGLEFTKCLTE